MICPNCNKENDDNVRFCSNCGFSLDQPSSPIQNTEENVKTAEELEKINKTAKTLTIISICIHALGLLVAIVALILFLIFDDLANFITSNPMIFALGFASVCSTAAIILVIIAMTKVGQNKIKNKFVKTVFITQIVLLVVYYTVWGCLFTYSCTSQCIHEMGCDNLSNCG